MITPVRNTLFLSRQDDATALSDLTTERSWHQLEQRCLQLQRYFHDNLNLNADENIALLMSNRVEFIEIIIAALLSGVWVTPVNRHLKQQEVQYIVHDCGAKYLLCDHSADNLREACDIPCISLTQLETELPQVNSKADLNAPPGGTMMYTSGTTGLPKGVKRSRPATLRDYLNTAWQFGTQVGLNGEGHHLVTGPLYHAAPMLLALYDLFNGATLTIMPQWDEKTFIRLVNEFSINHTHLVPTMFERLLKLPEQQKQSLDSKNLSVVHHGAAPISRETKQRMIDWWGPVLYEYWGATEGGITTFCDSKQWLSFPGTVGKALPQFEVYSCNEQRERLPAGENGVLYARHNSKAQVFEYHNDAEKTLAAHPEPYIFTLGDMGYVNNDGYVFLTDRLHNMIISGGVNIYPAEIEQVFKSHPDVSDIAVFGIGDDEWGEKVIAVIEPETLLDEGAQKTLKETLLGFSRKRLANYKIPREIYFQDQLPRNPAGKLIVRQIKEQFITAS